ncbi:MAG: TolC family protein [Gammaproteobacteria bacterium]|nr:TolC family protein [Gammaproteobacteria bacterium]
MSLSVRCRVKRCLLLGALWVYAWPSQAALTLDEAVAMARDNDPWLLGNEYRESALKAQSTAAGTLPDPVVNVGFVNVPTDSWDFDQENMTQFKVGVMQQFPRGDTRALSRQRLALLGSQYPHQRDDRRAKVTANITQLWLEAYRAQESIRLIELDRELFEHLVDVAQSSYSSALGRTRQQDLVRAQLELTRLEDRLAVLQERRAVARARLGEWLLLAPAAESSMDPVWNEGERYDQELAPTLPQLELLQPQLYSASDEVPAPVLARHLQRHPAILSIERRIDASRTDIELAEQKYRPQFSVNAAYGYREDDPMGNDRADFFSVGVAFDLPLFTSKRQDQQVQSAIADSEALRTEKWLALRNMMAAFATQRSRLQRLEQRRELYRSRLLQEMQEQAEASLTAYTRDDGDFSEVVRARIDELNARVEALDIEVDRLQVISQLNYFFAGQLAGAGGDES